ncbi:probable methyltransferase TARBP1 [Macrosteles quadrilineatus]|uniref:probable methyltransferase TARBP1 n=1 Tax=Macrosteles quadrilineatus TaxID=74068 RepID=UPI0023E26154|nr:probable methyltransferase TARBP1 [Macrosteles quadrilineatus]
MTRDESFTSPHSEIITHLGNLECLLKALISVKDKQKLNLPETLDTLRNINFLSAVKDFIIKFDDQSVSSVVLYDLVPKLIKVTDASIVFMLWTDLKSPLYSTNITLPVKLFALCGLSDYLNFKINDSSMIESLEFWEIIQEGLVSTDTLVRKQALYLMKRSIDIISVLNISLAFDIFSWNPLKSDVLLANWQKMFMLFEVLEEKQAHLVVPIIQSLLKASSFENTIESSWILAAYIRIFSHDSLQVVKVGITCFLEMNIEFFLSISSCTLVIEILFEKLNNTLLFSNPSNTVDWSHIDISLRKWFSNLSSDYKLCNTFIPVITHALTKVQWCAIPLFHLLYDLSLAPASNIFSEEDLTILSHFIKEVIKTQNIFIRGAVQCVMLKVLAKWTKSSDVALVNVIAVLSLFRQKECFKRGLNSWEISKEWITSFNCKSDDIIDILFLDENHLSIEAKARSLVLFLDSGLIDPYETKFLKAFKEYFMVLEDTFKRPYASTEESDKCLKLVFHILSESKVGSNSQEAFQHYVLIINSLSPYLKEVISYIEKRLLEVDQITNFENIELYISVLQVFSDMQLITFEKAIHLNRISKELCFASKNHPVQKLLALKVILWFITFETTLEQKAVIVEQVKEHCLSILEDGHLKSNIFSKSKSDELLSRNHQVQWGWLLSEYTKALWSNVQECLDGNIVSIEEILQITSAEDIIQLSTNAIESGGRESLVPVLKVVKYLIPEALKDPVLCKQFLRFSWKSCCELRKIALFWPSIKAWITLTFSKKVIATEAMRSIINEFAEEILSEGETVNGLSNVLLSHLRHELTDLESVKPLLSLLTKALIFGQVPRKDQRIEADTYTLIGNLGSELAINDLMPKPGYGNSQQVRLYALSVLLGVAKQDGADQLIVSAVNQLIDVDRQLTAKRQRYHGDSLHHRVKHRILQAVLVLHQALVLCGTPATESCLVEIVKFASAALQGESQQPSVRYQLEWLLVRALLSSPQLIDSFWTLFNEASEERTGSVCSFISVAYHLAACLRRTDFTERCVSEVLPWCMAQQFNIRLYAQVVLDKLWPLDAGVTAKYEVVRFSLTKSLKQGNTLRNAEKLKNDFYFTMFHPLRHFTLETIFMELPRLSNISRDEWIPLPTIEDSLSNYNPFIKLRNPDDSLTQFIPPSWVAKATADAEVEVEALAMQKKFVPWKNMFPEMEGVSSRTQLIVVASLIDKLPNLGGLTRTCEIFTAECLVVPSLEFTKDKMFSTLSMTAEKHINIVEVKPFDLPKFLREKKNAGYTLVGAEQTASSVSLQSFKFPKKCLLLLGNEKEGVPVNLLPLLDVCVEVPQLGVVRSLNVHVTGALFVWEYTKQYLEGTS